MAQRDSDARQECPIAMFAGFISRGPAVGEDEVAAFEARCGFPLPADYRAFLLMQNGGKWPASPRTETEGDVEWDRVLLPHHRFFSLGVTAAAGIGGAAAASGHAGGRNWPVESRSPISLW